MKNKNIFLSKEEVHNDLNFFEFLEQIFINCEKYKDLKDFCKDTNNNLFVHFLRWKDNWTVERTVGLINKGFFY